jgi:hypothetical protein
MSKFFLLIAVALSVSFECSVNAQITPLKAALKKLSRELYIKGIASSNGLEGFAANGVKILTPDYSDRKKGFSMKQIRDQVELRLRQSKIKVVDSYRDYYLMVDCQPSRTTALYKVQVSALSVQFFTADDVVYANSMNTRWKRGGLYTNLRDGINALMDDFLLAQLKAQEAHEKNKKELAAINKSAAKPSSATPSKK